MTSIQSTGAAVPACELLILLICVVLRPTDALTGEIATKTHIFLPRLTPLNIGIRYITDCMMEFITCCRVGIGSRGQQLWLTRPKLDRVESRVSVTNP